MRKSQLCRLKSILQQEEIIKLLMKLSSDFLRTKILINSIPSTNRQLPIRCMHLGTSHLKFNNLSQQVLLLDNCKLKIQFQSKQNLKRVSSLRFKTSSSRHNKIRMVLFTSTSIHSKKLWRNTKNLNEVAAIPSSLSQSLNLLSPRSTCRMQKPLQQPHKLRFPLGNNKYTASNMQARSNRFKKCNSSQLQSKKARVEILTRIISQQPPKHPLTKWPAFST